MCHLSGVNFHAARSFWACSSWLLLVSTSRFIWTNKRLTAGSSSIDWSCVELGVCDCLSSCICVFSEKRNKLAFYMIASTDLMHNWDWIWNIFVWQIGSGVPGKRTRKNAYILVTWLHSVRKSQAAKQQTCLIIMFTLLPLIANLTVWKRRYCRGPCLLVGCFSNIWPTFWPQRWYLWQKYS